MTALSRRIKRKLLLLHPAEELGNVAEAAKIMGFHRDTFYGVRKAWPSPPRACAASGFATTSRPAKSG